MYEIFNSIEDVWCVWIVSLIVFAICLHRPLSRFQWQSARRFARNESGASYALPYVLTFPFFILLMAVLIQATFIILVKIGTMYAAHSSVRTYIVWQNLEPQVIEFISSDEYIRYKTHRAAMMAMAPFANSDTRQRKSLFPLFPFALHDKLSIEKGALDLPVTLANALSNLDSIAYGQAYDRLVSDAERKDKAYTHPMIKQSNRVASRSYIRSKYAFAAAATRVTTPGSLVAWNQDVEVTVRYRMAFHIPVTARVFGGKRRFWSSRFFRDIETKIALPSEAADTPDGKIGIPYDNIFVF